MEVYILMKGGGDYSPLVNFDSEVQEDSLLYNSSVVHSSLHWHSRSILNDPKASDLGGCMPIPEGYH